MIFETKRCIIRPLEMFDLDGFHELESDPDVLLYADGNPKTYKENKKALEKLIEDDNLPINNFRIWAIITNEDDNFIGTCALITEEHKHELGIRFIKKYWGNGFGHEVLTGLIKHAVEIMGLNHLIAFVDERNKGSVALLEKSILDYDKKYWNEEDQCEELVFSKTF